MRSCIPKNYTLEFEPHFSNFTFSGKETVKLICQKPTSVIKLHAAELDIKNSSVSVGENKYQTRTKLDAKNEELQIILNQKVKGTVILSLEFTGILNDRLLGFYRSKYLQKGKTKYLATTQFEAADARRAFPCVDEPDAKATFDISIIADTTNTAISNMPIKSKRKFGKKTRYTFATTPVMSTYLVYLGVGDFEYLSGKQANITVRVITT